jgi:hypothetical protein
MHKTEHVQSKARLARCWHTALRPLCNTVPCGGLRTITIAQLLLQLLLLLLLGQNRHY